MKRIFDLVSAAAGLALLAPLFLIIGVIIRLDSPGPVFFQQRRLGKDGRVFQLLKFRTMVIDAEQHPLGMKTAESDPRITRVGAVLRRLSIDELPQLVNVVRGEMSLVGPRPAPVAHLDGYDARQRRRLEVRPGITGWAQVNGRNLLTWPERIEKDIWYVDHRSLVLDITIVLRTFHAAATSRGIYSGRNDAIVEEVSLPKDAMTAGSSNDS